MPMRKQRQRKAKRGAAEQAGRVRATVARAAGRRGVRLGSLNVHGWQDASFLCNEARVVELVRAQRIDVLAVQESTGEALRRVARTLGYQCTVLSPHWGSAILSRLPILSAEPLIPPDEVESWDGGPAVGGDGRGRGKVNRRRRRHFRRILCVVDFHGIEVELVVVHLDHVLETRRLHEVHQTVAALAAVDAHRQPRAPAEAEGVGAGAARPRFWLGDFNALSRSDYEEDEWGEIYEVRRRNRWELPVSEVTDHMRGALGLSDLWAATGRVGSYVTCRFDTRIDYIFASPAALAQLRVRGPCRHVYGNLTDHNLVVVDVSPAADAGVDGDDGVLIPAAAEPDRA